MLLWVMFAVALKWDSTGDALVAASAQRKCSLSVGCYYNLPVIWNSISPSFFTTTLLSWYSCSPFYRWGDWSSGILNNSRQKPTRNRSWRIFWAQSKANLSTLSSWHSLNSNYYNPPFTMRKIKLRGVPQLTQGCIASVVKPGMIVTFLC